MSTFSLDHFTAATDAEAARYRILAELQAARRAFDHNCVYPHLANLIRVRRGLRLFLDGVGEFRDRHPGRVTGIDWQAMRLTYEGEGAPLLAEDLARWALPLITEAVEHGRTLYEFIDECAVLEAVGLVPAYQHEGYLLVPHEDRVEVLRYAISAIAGSDGRYRSLRTSTVEATLAPFAPPQMWKEALVAACPDLPTPATYHLAADLDFPLEATMIPIAKRKLLRLITDYGEA